MGLLMVALILLGVSGLLALVCAPYPRLASSLGAGGAVLAGLLGLVPACGAVLANSEQGFSAAWLTTAGGSFTLALDSLSGFFLIVILGVGGTAALYGGSYMLAYAAPSPSSPEVERKTVVPKNIGLAWLFFNLLLASMVVIVLARNGLLFLIAWETMALTSYFLVTFENEKEAVCRAGWIYLIAAHLATGVLFALFVLLRGSGASLDFAHYAAHEPYSQGFASLLLVMALIGFGTKAGLVPLHVWLPEAHPVAPSHVSAVLSAVMTKMGIYGLLRVLQFLGPPQAWWGSFLMILGLLGALVGISLALSQRDLKRSLAYSTVENIGLITLGLGIGLWGRANGQAMVAVLGFAGALLHIWNHSLMKGLMFLTAGSVLHGAGSRDIEQLGGLLKRMPWTGMAMLLGAVAIAALPPLNGFVGEWLLYLGLLEGGLTGTGWACLLGVGLLALVGGLAAICFVRLVGLVLLGQERTERVHHAHEVSLAMRIAMMILLAGCVAIGVMPHLALIALAETLHQILHFSNHDFQEVLARAQISLKTLSIINVVIWITLAGLAGLLVYLCRRNGIASSVTWGCGYANPTPRIQYTGRSFAEFMAEEVLPRTLRPQVAITAPVGLFPEPVEFTSTAQDPIKEKIYEPFFQRWAQQCSRIWWLQHGKLNIYLFYLLVLVVLGLGWVSLKDVWFIP